MDSVALFVDFDDVIGNLEKKSLSVSPTLLAQSLRRTARVFGSPLKAYACANWRESTETDEPSPREAFEQQKFEVIAAGRRDEAVWRMTERIFRFIYDEATPPKTFILVTNDGQFASAVERLCSRGFETRLWVVGEEIPAELASLDAEITPLEELLDLQPKTMAHAKTMALFVDLENIAISLNNLGFLVDPEVLARSLRSQAQRQGSLIESYAYADWHKLPPAVDATGKNLMAEAQRIFELSSIETRYLITIAGKNTADMRMADDIRDLLEDRNQPDVFVIASGDRDFSPIIDTLVRAHKQVLVWGVEGCTSPSLSKLARVEYIQNFVPLLKRGQTQPTIAGEPPAVGATVGVQPGTPGDPEEGRPTVWTKLAIVLDDLMKRNNWRWVSLSRATNELAKLKEFGPAEEDARYVLNQAVARGIVLKERIQNPNPNYPDQFVWAFRSNEDSVVVRAARLVPERIIEIMKYGLGRMEYVAFSYLQTQLARDRSLTQPWLNLDEEGRTQWINFLIAEGVIHASRRPHHRNPGDLVTALTLVNANNATTIPRQPLSLNAITNSNSPEEGSRWAVKEGRSEGTSEAVESQSYSETGMWKRLVISVDSFTARSGMDWAPLITLRQRLSMFGREEMETVLRRAQEAGDLTIQEYPNPNKPYPTKGASLNASSEAVRAVLSERDSLLSALVRARTVDGELTNQSIYNALGEVARSEEQCNLWLSMLVGERILSWSPVVPGQPRTYQLNSEHPIVRRATGESETYAAGTVAAECEAAGREAERSLTSL